MSEGGSGNATGALDIHDSAAAAVVQGMKAADLGFKFDTMMDTEDPIQFARKIGVRYPLAVASDDLKKKLGGVEGLPTTLLYDRDGILRKKVIGFEYTNVIESDLKQLF